jgi:sugar-specific transcriptional regulator TrmB
MPHEIHYQILEQLGINTTEALIYELLLELGPKTGQELVAPSGLGRGNVYNILTSLKKKGFVFEEVGTKTVFKAADPEVLRALAKNKLVAAQELNHQLEATLPTLKSQYRLITKKPTIRVFEGVEGMKEIYKEILTDATPVFALVGADTHPKTLYRWLRTWYVKQRIEKQIPVYGILSGAMDQKMVEELMAHANEELRLGVIVDANVFPFQGEVNVFGNKIAFLNYKEDELIGWIVESPAMATTLRSTVQLALHLKGADYAAFAKSSSSS